MAVQKIYDIKQRVKTKEMPVLGFSKKDIKIIAEFNTTAEKIATRYWPGKITLVLKLKDLRLQESLGVTKSIAVRVPNNDCALSILEKCRLLVGTSANVSGTKPFVDPKDGLENINGYDIFVDGGIIQSDGKSSTILDCTTDEIIILREGAIKVSGDKKGDILNLIITCPRHFEEDAAEEITAMLKEFGYESIPDITITDMPGILTVIIPNENPIEIIEKIREKTREEPWSVRYLQRVIPIQMTLESEITQIVDGISKICSIMNHDQTYRITIEKRHSNLSSKEMITQIAKKDTK